MKILYDSQIFRMQNFGGISRYFNELCRYNGGRFDFTVSGKWSDNVYAPSLSGMKPFPVRNYFKGKNTIVSLSDILSDRYAIARAEYDIYHPTYYFVPEYPKKRPVVITAYDFIHELFPEYFSPEDSTCRRKKISLSKASRIIAISQSTKKDLLKLYPDIDESKVDVVHLAGGWDKKNTGSYPSTTQKPYILFTGQRGGYKNFQTFTKAIAQLLKINDLNLICTGNVFNMQEKTLFDELGISDRIFQVFSGENELRSLYENALCFVFPSLYEGFGIPILEAFSTGCPAVLSDTSCFPEIAGDAAAYFDPRSESNMTEKISEVIQSESMRQELVKKGQERFNLFTMDKMIEGSINVYKSVLKSF